MRDCFLFGLKTSEEIWEALSERLSSRELLALLDALETHYGGTPVAMSGGARRAIKVNNLLPYPGRVFAGMYNEYHHVEFKGATGERFVAAVPFDSVEKIGGYIF